MYYSMDGEPVYCNNIQELMKELQLQHLWALEAFQWFIYSHFEDSVNPQSKSVPSYPTRSGSSHERNVQALSGFLGKNVL